MQDRLLWSGYEFEYREKTTDWYWAVSIISLCGAIVCFLYGDPLFGVLIIMSGLIFLFTANKEPKLYDYELTDKGFLIDETLYPHLHMKAFWVAESKYGPPKLLFRTSKVTNPIIVIPIETDYVDAETIRNFLLNYVPEERIDEPLSLKFLEFLGF